MPRIGKDLRDGLCWEGGVALNFEHPQRAVPTALGSNAQNRRRGKPLWLPWAGFRALDGRQM